MRKICFILIIFVQQERVTQIRLIKRGGVFSDVKAPIDACVLRAPAHDCVPLFELDVRLHGAERSTSATRRSVGRSAVFNRRSPVFMRRFQAQLSSAGFKRKKTLTHCRGLRLR